MIRFPTVNQLQRLVHIKTGAPTSVERAPLLPAVHLSHSPSAPALYPTPSIASRLKSRWIVPGGKLAHLQDLVSQRTWNGTFSVHTRVGCINSPLNDLPQLAPAARKSKQLSAKQQQRKAIAANRLQNSMSNARKAAATGLFHAEMPPPCSAAMPAANSTLQAMDLIAGLFPTATDQQFCDLQQSLHNLDLPAQTDRTMLAYALASAADGDVAIAQQVMARLSRGLDLIDTSESHIDDSKASITGRARKLAGLLSQDQAGFTMLQAMHPSHAGYGRAARVLLQSGLSNAHRDPTSLAARAHAAALRMLDPRAKLADAEKAAIFAWEQGFRSDGEGSPLHFTQKQLARFANKTIPRVESSRFSTFIPRLVGCKKSPLVALNQGMHGATRPSLAKEREKVKGAMQATVAHLLTDVLQDPSAILREKDPVGALASLATLQYWSRRPDSYPGQRIAIADAAALNKDMMHIISTIESTDRRRYPMAFAALQNAASAFRDDPENALLKRPAVRRLMRQPLTPKRLKAWGKLRKIPADDSFWQHLDTLKASLRPPNFRPLKRRCLSTQQNLGTLIDGLGSSSRLRLTDGARRGLSTRGLSFNLGRLLNFSGIPLGPRLNLGREKRRRAIIEIGRSSHGGEILIGSERCRRTTIGAGFMFGYDLKMGPPQARIAVSVDVEKTKKKTEFSGIALRVAQRKRADGKADHERRQQGMRNIMDFMFKEQQMDATPEDNPERLFERFAAKFFDDEDISLSWNDASGKSNTYGVSAVASALLKVDNTPLNFGPGVGVTAERTTAKASDFANFTGRMQSAFSRKGKTTDVELTVGIKGKLSTETPGHVEGGLGVGLLNASLPAWTIPIHTSGTTGKALLIRENGKLLPTCSVLDLEFTRAADYIDALKADRHQWIARLSKKFVGNPEALTLATREFDQFMQTTQHHARRNQRFVQRLHLRADIASEIDRHSATAALIRNNEHISVDERERLCAVREAACAELVTQPGAWVPKELKVIEKSSSCSRLGLLIGLQLATETSGEGEHQLANLRM
ncbi:MAG: hypothetical protein V4695_07105 [Pseudomonadota bacterium]